MFVPRHDAHLNACISKAALVDLQTLISNGVAFVFYSRETALKWQQSSIDDHLVDHLEILSGKRLVNHKRRERDACLCTHVAVGVTKFVNCSSHGLEL